MYFDREKTAMNSVKKKIRKAYNNCVCCFSPNFIILNYTHYKRVVSYDIRIELEEKGQSSPF